MRPYLRAYLRVFACTILLFSGSSAFADDGPEHQTEAARPVLLGISGGNIKDFSRTFCCGGTLGALVEDANGALYILGNNHVLARTNKGEPGDDIIQPGLIDQQPVCSLDTGDTVAHLTRFVPISFKKGTNTVDAAIAETDETMVNPTGEILDIGKVDHTPLTAVPGLLVTKSGRTTGQTFGQVVAVNVTVDVAYDKQCGVGTQIARFKNQMLIVPESGSFSAGGDSGSLIVEDVNGKWPQPVGLLFAGSSASTLANPIQEVLDSLCVAMVGSKTFPDPDSCADGGGGGNGKGGGPPPGKGPKNKNLPAGLEVASKVKARHEVRLFGIDGVVGTGVSVDEVGQPVIEVYVKRATPQVVRQIPGNLEGIPVRVVETGPFRAR